MGGASFVYGIGSKPVFPQMLDRARRLIDGALVTSLDEVAAAVRLLAERCRVIAEGAGACPVACALSGQAGTGKIACIVSGVNIDAKKLCNQFRNREARDDAFWHRSNRRPTYDKLREFCIKLVNDDPLDDRALWLLRPLPEWH